MQKFWIVYLQSKDGGAKHGPHYQVLEAAIAAAKKLPGARGTTVMVLEAVAYVEPPVEPEREIKYLS